MTGNSASSLTTILIYDDTCKACNFIKRVIKWFDVKDNITPLPIRLADEVFHCFYAEGEEIPYTYAIVTFETLNGETANPVLYTARKAIPQIIKAILRRP
jgi:hypothetical protein